MLKKRRFKKQGITKVTFVLPPEVEADRIHLMGEFNNWQTAHVMRRRKDGSWRTTLNLEPGRAYEFRYLVDGERWLNDPDADDYVPNSYGSQNSVVAT